MTILIARAVTPCVRGEISKWLIEVDAGVFVGSVSARVREKLWERLFLKLGEKGAAILIYSAQNEQGYEIRTEGLLDRTVVEFEGLSLIRFNQVRIWQ